MTDLPFPRGVRDLLPNEAIFKNELLKKIESVFQRFGFTTISTPAIESLKILKAKGAIGEESKLIYELKEEELGLRYEHTVSLARYFIMHSALPLPFKRYVIGEVWRMDEPQRGRYREITQADIDIIGGDRPRGDAEVIASICAVFDELGLGYVVRLNNRELVDMILKRSGMGDEKSMQVMRIVDKLDKLGINEVTKLLKEIGLSKETMGVLTSFISQKGTNDDKLRYADGLVPSKEPIEEIRRLVELLKQYGIKESSVTIDFSLMRGLDYYTGCVCEFLASDTKVGRLSIGGGGRYDNLIALYGGQKLPAFGVSIGVDRLLDVLNFSSSAKRTYSKVFVAVINDKNYPYALSVARKLREAGIETDVNISSRNISNQLSYANSLKIPYTVIVGDSEEKLKLIKLRDMVSGEETAISVNELIGMLGTEHSTKRQR